MKLGKITLPRDIKPSTDYMAFLPCVQSTGDATDKSGNNADAALGAALSAGTAWNTPGYIETAAGADLTYAASIPKAQANWDANTQSLILSFVANFTTATDRLVLGNGAGSSAPGFAVRADSGGKLLVWLNGGDSRVTGPNSTLDVFDGTPHHVVVAIDGFSMLCYVWVDGTLDATYNGYDFSAAGRDTTSSYDVSIGATTAATYDTKWSGIHILTPAALPSNITQIALFLASVNRFTPLSTDQL